MKYNDGFKCDKKAKEVTKNLIYNWFSACTVSIDEENEMNDYAPVDILYTAYTQTKSAEYAIEIKHRMGYSHTDYDSWMIEEEKYNTLLKYKKYGYRVFYLNIFKDGYYAMWDLNTITSYSTESVFSIRPHTQAEYEEKPVEKKRILIPLNKAFKQGYIDDKI